MALYGTLLDARIEIYKYRKGYLHEKIAAIDGHWVTVGSSDIDPFSLLLSREANLVIEDDGFGETLAQSLKNPPRQRATGSWRIAGSSSPLPCASSAGPATACCG